MSLFRSVMITCPKCNKEGSYGVWDSVNVDLDPKLKTKVMDGSLFKWVCPHCGKEFNAPYSFLYHDMKHNFMVQFDAESGHLIPFAEYIRVLENELNMGVIDMIEAKYMDDHLEQSILFDRLNEDGDLVFSVMELTDGVWVFTERKHVVVYKEYAEVKG